MKISNFKLQIAAIGLAAGSLFAATEPISVNTADGKVKQTSSGVGAIGKPFDFSLVSTTGISGGGGGLTTAGNLAPIFTTGVVGTSLNFTLSTAGAHTFLGNSSGGVGAPAYVQPAFSDLSGSATDAQVPNTLTLSTISNLTTNGFVKTGGGTGALSVDTLSHKSSYTVNVKDPPYNAAGNGSTDDTTAIQTAITDVWNAGGGTVFFPSGTYLVNGAFDATTNSVLKIPYNASSNASKSITFLGEVEAPWLTLSTTQSTSGSIIKCTKTGTGTQPALLAGAAFSNSPGVTDFNYTYVYIKGLTFRTYENPSINALRLETIAGAQVENVKIDVGNTAGTYPAQPGNNTVGYWSPKSSNAALNMAKNVLVEGYSFGYKIGEHFQGEWVFADLCSIGFDMEGVNEGSSGKLGTFWCPTAIRFPGGNHATDIFIDIERGPAAQWYSPVQDIQDVGSFGFGTVRYMIATQGIGPVTTGITVTGATTLRFVDLWNPLDQMAGAKWNFIDPTDITKKFKFDASGITTATTRTVTVPNADSTWVTSQSASTLLGRTSASAGFPQSITLGTNLSMSGTTLNATGGASVPGADTQIIFNDAGAEAGDADHIWAKTTNIETITSAPATNTVADAFVLQDTTAATAANQQFSGALRYLGKGWDTGTASSKTSEFRTYDKTVQANPMIGQLTTEYQNNGGGWNMIQYMDSRGFVGLPNGTTALPALIFGAASTAGISNDGSANLIVSNGSSNVPLAIDTVARNLKLSANTGIDWTSASDNPTGTVDTGLDRNAAGVVEVNNGTAGTFKDIKVDRVNAVTGYRINGAAAAGKILVGDGTNYVASTPTYPNASATSGKIIQSDGTNFIASTATWPTTNTAGYKVQGGGANYTAYPTGIINSSVTTVSAGYSSDTYLAGSAVTVAAGDWKVNGVYHCRFDMTKTAAGTATPIISVRMGTLGTTGDTAVGTITFAAGTAAADTGTFDVDVVFRTVGSGTSAVVQMMGVCNHHLAATGLTSTGASGTGIIVGTSSGFASTTQTKLGLSFNGGTSFAGTNTIATAVLNQP